MKNKKILWCSFWTVMFIGALLVMSQRGYSDGDDAYFYQYTHEMDFFSYLGWRYEQWVGRLAGEAMVYITFRLGLPFWRVMNTLMLVLLPMGILRLAVAVCGTTETKSFGAATASVAGYFLMNAMTLGYAAVWVNGSIFYTWSFTCGVWALLPFAELVFQGRTDWKRFFYSMPCAVIASMSIEQMGAVLLVFEALGVLYCFLRQRKPDRQNGQSRQNRRSDDQLNPPLCKPSSLQIWLALVQTVLTVVAFAVLFAAPGNDIRVESEVSTWMPEYKTLSFGHHLFITVQWLLSSFANENKLFLCMIWILGIMILLQRGRHTAGECVWVCAAGVFAAASLLPFAGVTALSDMGMNIVDITVCIASVPTVADLTASNIAAMCWWTAALVFTFLFLCKVSGFQIVYLLAYLAGIASEAIMFFSPTMYASGARVYYLTDLLYLFVVLGLSFSIKQRGGRRLFYGIMTGFGICNFLYQIPLFLSQL